MKKRGFTIVELLIVMGIIAVLIGILISAMGAIRAQSKRTACAADLRTIGQMLLMYRDAHQNTWPQGPSQMPDLRVTYSAYNFLPMQIDLYPSTVWQCPDDTSQLYPVAGSSYVYTDPQTVANLLTLENSPGTLPTTVECQGTYGYTDAGGNVASIAVPVFHNGKFNILYADGHVELP